MFIFLNGLYHLTRNGTQRIEIHFKECSGHLHFFEESKNVNKQRKAQESIYSSFTER